MIPAERSHLHVAARSHPGMSGKNNEDRYAVSALRLSHDNPLPVVFAVVSDGIGGHRAGEIAAEIAIHKVSDEIEASDASNPVKTLKQAIVHASEKIHTQSEQNPEYRGMGATCACGWVIDNRLYVANVGDSRIYLIRNGQITQVSSDHTWIQEAIDAGLLTPEEANGHPNTHVIRRYLGSNTPVEPDLRLRLDSNESTAQSEKNQGLILLPGDQVLLCSDGLTDLVEDQEILTTMETEKLEKALDQLVDLANQRGGHDNITIVAMKMPKSVPQAEFALPGTRKSNTLRIGLIVSMVLALISVVLVVGTYLIWNYGLSFPLPTAEDTPTQQIIQPTMEEILTLEASAEPTITQALTPEPTLTSWPVTPAAPE